ncbi:MAG: flagellar motor switch protein FliN [Magnetovibrio sp.]|nr:flagellar motor switch protein FliN [Magnetovibrio sp.]
MSTDENNPEQEEEVTAPPAENDGTGKATTEPAPETIPEPEYQAANLKDLDGPANGNSSPAAGIQGTEINLDVILDVPVTISVEIGRSQIPIRQLLQYNQGSVIELDRHVGEPLDVLVNKTLIAHGEVVMIDDQFGIRLTDVISPSERVKKLR